MPRMTAIIGAALVLTIFVMEAASVWKTARICRAVESAMSMVLKGVE